MTKRFFLLLSVVLLSYSCSIDDGSTPINYYYTNISSVEMPQSFELGETYEIPVTFDVPGECYTFSGFEVVRGESMGRDENTSRTVRVVLAGFNESECEGDPTIEVTRDLRFQVIFDQEYTFRFFTGSDDEGNPEFIEYVVPVE